MKSLLVVLTIFMLCSFSSENKTQEKLSRKLFNEIGNEIDKLVSKPKENDNYEVDNLSKVDLENNSEEGEEGEEDEVNGNVGKNTGDQDDEEKRKQAKKGLPSKKPKKRKLKTLPYGEEVRKAQNLLMQDWFTITSSDYAKLNKYPIQEESDIHLNSNYTRINDKWKKEKKGAKDVIPGQNFFWFRHNLKYIYYFDSKSSYNALGSIYMDSVADARDIVNNKTCFTILMQKDVTYKLCALNPAIKKKWLCHLQKLLKVRISKLCGGLEEEEVEKPQGYREETVIQPLVLIPMAAKHCNEEWNYARGNYPIKLIFSWI